MGCGVQAHLFHSTGSLRSSPNTASMNSTHPIRFLARFACPYAAVLGLYLSFGPTYAGELPVFEIVARDGKLLPPQIEVPAGKRLKLAIRNEGSGPIEFENLDLRVEKVLAPGASSFVVTPPLKPGIHAFVDDFHPDTGKTQLIAR